MIEELKPYGSYRQTELPWAPSLPTHWTTRRAKTLFTKKSRPVQPDHDIVTCFRDGVVTLRKNRRTTGFTQAIFELGYQGIRRGDLVIHAMDAFAGAVGVSDSDGKGSPVYAVCEARSGALPAYYAHVVREMARSQWIVALSRGIRQRSTDFRFDVFAAQNVPLPPPEEQAAIVRFLDHANRRIDQFMRSKKKLIALLNEQKQAIIHRAVTRGLDLNVKLKDSGVPSLGQIPVDWYARPLKAMASIQSGITLGKNYEATTLAEYPYLRVANVQVGRLALDRVTTVLVPAADAARSMLRPGDVLMTEGGDPDKLGRGCIWRGEISPCLHQNHVFAVRTQRQLLLPDFLEMALAAAYSRDYFMRTAKQTTNLASTNKTTVGNHRVATPPLEEQRATLAALSQRLSPVHSAVATAESNISLIREYRTRLVSDVVTGQLDVRTAVASLPGIEPDASSLEAFDDGETDINDSEAA